MSCGTNFTPVIERALFGRADAVSRRASRRKVVPIESVDGGTLFLDDIGDMPFGAQARLLRFLTERERMQVNGSSHAVDVRIVGSAPGDLDEHVETGRILSICCTG